MLERKTESIDLNQLKVASVKRRSTNVHRKQYSYIKKRVQRLKPTQLVCTFFVVKV